MSFQAMAWAVTKPCKNAGEKLVLLMLANYCNTHTGRCNPSHKRMADECSMGVSTLKRHLSSLASAGFIEIVPMSRDGVSLPNQYNIPFGGVEFEGSGSKSDGGSAQIGLGVGPNRATNLELNQEENQEHEQQAARSPSRFNEFWEAYPRKKGKADAVKAWKRKGLDKIADKIIADVKARKSSDKQWLDGFIPHGNRYINGETWRDEIETASNGRGGGDFMARAV